MEKDKETSKPIGSMGFAVTESIQDEGDKIIPAFRFAPVEDGFYRGAYPTNRNFRHLRR